MLIRSAMPLHPESRIAGLILAAGASRRLGRPKQLLPYGDGVLLDAVLATARGCGFSQIVPALGGSGDDVRRRVDTSGWDVVDNPGYERGCSSSIALLEQRAADVAEVAVAGRIQPDVDTEADYAQILAPPGGVP